MLTTCFCNSPLVEADLSFFPMRVSEIYEFTTDRRFTGIKLTGKLVPESKLDTRQLISARF